MLKSLISVKNLIVDFDITNDDGLVVSKRRAIDDISFDINEGDFVCVIGCNGSGKSTLAKTFNALILPTSGNVEIFEMNTKDENKTIDIRRKIGMAFQNPDNQIVASIVEEDVAFGLENLGIKSEEIRERIDDAMKRMDIYDLKDNVTSKLSGGQKQRVSIAGILAMKSDIIVLDEPTSMIDKAGRKEFLSMVKNLNKNENKTIILISHYIEEMLEANRVIVMDKGKILYDDTPKNILLKADELIKLGIGLPYVSELSYKLKQKGINLRGNEIIIKELLDEIFNY